MNQYIALLRGINVGGNKKVPMADLKACMEQAGYSDVKTLLNTGNVVFESQKTVTASSVEESLKKQFGFDIPVILRSDQELKKLIKADPFKRMPVTKETRLYVTFLSKKPMVNIKLPYVSESGDFKILTITDQEIISVLTLTKNTGTTDSMKILEKEFGKNITTRNWNTVQKIGALL